VAVLFNPIALDHGFAAVISVVIPGAGFSQAKHDIMYIISINR
jgi:hypothetical protein